LIDKLQIPYNAQFYKLKEGLESLPNIAINNILRQACRNRKGRYLVGLDYTRIEGNFDDMMYKFTLRIFPTSRKVTFLTNDDDYEIEDIIHAYILILEFDDNVVIFKKSTANFSTVLTDYLTPYPHELILKVIDDEHASIQRISLRNMTVSGSAIHAQSYETPSDLKGLLSPHAIGRSIPSGIRYKEGSITKSVTASTARILETSQKSGIEDLVAWAIQQVHKIHLRTENYFIQSFAKPVDLQTVLEESAPKAMLIELNKFKDAIDEDEIQVGIEYKGRFREFNKRLYLGLFLSLEETFEIVERYEIVTQTQIFNICYDEKGAYRSIGTLKINSKSLTFNIPIFNRIKIKRADGTITSLAKYFISKRLYSIVFDNIKYMYYMGSCYKDESGVSEIDSILNALVPKTELNGVMSEKGTISETHTKFDEDSMFAVVEDIHSSDEYIFCDDFGNEWCDHITIDVQDNTINFIHSKAKEVSLRASNMHDVVSQGIKNLGNMFFTIDEFERIKKEKFEQNYRNSQIPRIRKGALEESDLEIISSVINNHKTHRQCILSCSFLSKSLLEAEFEKIKNGENVRGNIIQMLWILSSFLHACRGMHVIPLIYCKE